MSLMLRIIRHETMSLDLLENLDFELQERPCLIGRSKICDWKLTDEDRVLSSVHCMIQYFNHDYYLVDNSLNGVFVNQLEEPIGKGKNKLLMDGDVIHLGEFSIEVILTATYTEFGWEEVSVEDDEPNAADGTMLDLKSQVGKSPAVAALREKDAIIETLESELEASKKNVAQQNQSLQLKNQQIALLSEAVTNFSLRPDVQTVDPSRMKSALEALLNQLS